MRIILLQILRCEKKTTAYLEILKKKKKYIYIYIYREREREREKKTKALTKLIMFK